MPKKELVNSRVRKSMVDDHLLNQQQLKLPANIKKAQPQFKLEKSDQEKWKSVCGGEVMYIIIHRFGTDDFNQSTKGLLNYIKEVFGFDNGKFNDLFQTAKERPHPKRLVKVEVLQARDLEAKDVNGYSDPFCMLGIVKNTDVDFRRDIPAQRGGSLRTKNKKEKKPKRCSSSSSSSINSFSSSGSLATDINKYDHFRDHDDDVTVLDAASKVMKIKGVTGISRYFKQVLQSATTGSDESVDDFLGCIDIPLSEISAMGTEGWYDLQARSSRSNVQGQCQLKIQFSTAKGSGFHLYDPRELYAAVNQKFAEYEAELFFSKNKDKSWDCDLSVQALSVLSQIAMHYDISICQQSMYAISCVCKIHNYKQIDYKVLANELKQICNQSLEQYPDEVEDFISCLEEFVERCMTMFHYVRGVFPYKDEKSAVRLNDLLTCLELIYSIPEFQKKHQNKTLLQDIQTAFKKATEKWYANQCSLLTPKTESIKSELQTFNELAEKIFTDLHAARNYYNNLFTRIGEDYFTTVFFTIDHLVARDMKKIMEAFNDSSLECSEKVDKLTFQVYFTLKELTKYRMQLEPENQSARLNLDSLHKWFSPLVKMWFDWTHENSVSLIKKAVEIEEVEVIDSYVKYSTSAVDASCCFQQTCDFWKELDWPDADDGFALLAKLVDDICTAGTCYVDLIYDRLERVHFYDDEGQFDITEQLCVTLNNLDHVRRTLESLPERLNFEKVTSGLSHHGNVHAENCRAQLLKIIESGDENFNVKTSSLINNICKKMGVGINQFIQQFSKVPENVDIYQAINPLLQYLDNNLIKLNECLFGGVFDKIVVRILNVVMENFWSLVSAKSTKPAKYYERLWDCLEILLEFFVADGNGVKMSVILNDGFYSMSVSYLTKAKLDTGTLIGLYFKDKLEYQAKKKEFYGSLTFKVFYSSTAQSLFVNVINAKNLPVLDSNGKADPYVTVELCPSHIFKCAEKSTKIVKKTLDPYFGETFTFNISDKLCSSTNGAVVLFTVMDYNILRKNDYAGECAVSLNNVPGLSWDENVPGMGADLPEIEVNLTHPDTSGEIFAILNSRTSCDKEAMTFVKKRISMYEAAQDSLS
ncbi:uncharacterized protein TRIADDRAFT_60504 [Trichoplax adhaerens]|uniref:BAI1-associated protein 3 n=1 Tax=Trichoplax adhaerens TaxID=10228 RepID=B3S8D8_TRIAD|nr:hypothetical protein TRIADDRAFT_60504 [Trichoplax adhaerens]EDV20863.1 hypothetical protein TRIADDRAFT_60504 [Trichoplax adhaerens]|eukprot:XP_002116507.1 hypothetical protein TRIADDRAFT_60504 [Trichoplax adhaerens]